MMRLIIVILLIFVSSVIPQKLKGFVYESAGENKTPLPGVNLIWAGTTIGTATDADGRFELIKTSADSARLIIRYVAYKPDTIWVAKPDEYIEIMLSENVELDEVVVTARTKGITVNEMEAIFSQKISKHELKKAACCNLSESFETNASVDVSYGDAVTGAKQIKLLGLAGKYSQIMTENIPNLRGLASSFGIYYVPGPWMESIQISKGTASVINGFESTTGQVNVEFKKPFQSERFYADIFSTDNLKSDVNMNFSRKFGENLSTALFLHGEYFGKNIDHNKDSFIDHPNVRQFNILNKWNYEVPGSMHIAASINYLTEDRFGGQTGFGSAGFSNPYRSIIKTDRLQVWTKTGFMFSNDANMSIGFINMITVHDQKSSFGLRKYDAEEFSYYSNFIFESNVFNDRHKINAGLGLSYDRHKGQFEGLNLDKNELIPGAFFQYTFLPLDNLTFIAGIRADQHNEFGGFVTPRFHLRYSPFENTTFRLSAGKGFRSANIIPENIQLLSTSRVFYVHEKLQMEEAVNYGINLTQYFDLFGREMSIAADYYRTDFLNKVVADIDKNPREVHFYNLSGESYSDNYQLEISYELFKQFDVLGAVRFTDTKTTYSDGLLSDPLEKQFRGLVSVSYLTDLRLWQFDFTAQFNGESRIPNKFSSNQSGFSYSPAYTNLMAQITRYFKGWEIFVGAENITNYTQKDPVISSENPFGPDYDASLIWGPIEGRKFYVGLRLIIK